MRGAIVVVPDSLSLSFVLLAIFAKESGLAVISLVPSIPPLHAFPNQFSLSLLRAQKHHALRQEQQLPSSP